MSSDRDHLGGRARAHFLAMLAGLALVLALAFASAADAAPAKHQRDGTGVRPTIVLIHGAWGDSANWNGVTRRLQRLGYTVDVPPDPLRGLIDDAAYVSAYLQTIQGPIVLVGHSYGGAVITNAATGNPNVKALVYINAFVPDLGETVASLNTQMPGSAIAGDPTAVFDFVPYPDAANGDVDLYVKPDVFRIAFANDLSASRAAVLAATQHPVTFSALNTASGTPAWKTIPSWYLRGTRDRVIPPAEQLFMARRAHAHLVSVPASHMSMVSRPDAVAALVLAAAVSVR
jgi:pimeloyl-ACP methyl ester carboxylesterase